MFRTYLLFIITTLVAANQQINLPRCAEGSKIFAGKYVCSIDPEAIGRGASGIAYLVNETSSKLNRVLKISSLELSSMNLTPTFTMHERLRGLPNVITRYEIKTDGSFIYEILEHASHGSMLIFMKEFDYIVDQRVILELFEKIVKGIESIHRRGIVHADIKPGNIVVDENFVPKIIDFDLSVEMNTKDSVRGTLPYMAPEILTSYTRNVKYTEKVDIWALGISLYTILYQKQPYKGHKKFTLLSEIEKQTLTIMPRTSIEVIQILLMMLKFDPNKRSPLKEVRKAIKAALKERNWNYITNEVTVSTDVTDSNEVLKYVSGNVVGGWSIINFLSSDSNISSAVTLNTNQASSLKDKPLVFFILGIILLIGIQLLCVFVHDHLTRIKIQKRGARRVR